MLLNYVYILIMVLAAGLEGIVQVPAEDALPAQVVRRVGIEGAGGLKMPTDVAVDSAGRVYVADGVNRRVVRFDASGQVDNIYRQAGDEAMVCPMGLFVDHADRLWIADSKAGCIWSYSSRQDSWSKIELGEVAGRRCDPTDVVLSEDRSRMYIVDNDSHRILLREVLSGETTVLGRFGESLGRFRWPFMIAVSLNNTVLVTEAIGARVQRITSQDKWAGVVGRWGVSTGGFYRPKGVAADTRGRIYVSDSTLNVVQVFDVLGRFLGVLTDEQRRPIRFEHPMGLWVDGEGLLYVTELKADRVAVIDIPQLRQLGEKAAADGKEKQD